MATTTINKNKSKPPVKPIISVFVLIALAIYVAMYIFSTFSYEGLIIIVPIDALIGAFAVIIFVPSLPSSDFPGNLIDLKDEIAGYRNDIAPLVDIFYVIEPELMDFVTKNQGAIIDEFAKVLPELLPVIKKMLTAIAMSNAMHKTVTVSVVQPPAMSTTSTASPPVKS